MRDQSKSKKIIRVLFITFLTATINITFGTTSKVISSMSDIRTLSLAIEMYKMDTSEYPTTETWKQDLLSKEYLFEQDAFIDPWGNEYIYNYPGINNLKSFDIYSLGKDEFSETDGNDKDDVNNWDDEHTWLYEAYGFATQHQIISIQIGMATLGILIISVTIYGVYFICKKRKKENIQ